MRVLLAVLGSALLSALLTCLVMSQDPPQPGRDTASETLDSTPGATPDSEAIASEGSEMKPSLESRARPAPEAPKADLELQKGCWSTGFYGGCHGYLMDLGAHAIDEVDADANRPPAGLPAKAVEQWEWMWKEAEAKSEKRPDRRKIPGKAPDLKDRVKAEPGHTYLVRAILPGQHDLLVVFRAVEEDEYGASLLYHILHEFEMPKRR